MTSFQMDTMLKSIRVERKGGRLLISGRAIVDGKTAVFMVSRKVPLERKPKVSPIKLIWLEELSNFDMKGKTK